MDTGFWLSEIVRKSLQEGKTFIQSFLLVSPGDEYLKQEQKEEKILIFNKKEIYYLYHSEDVENQRISPGINSDTPWPTLLGIISASTTLGKNYHLGFNNIEEETIPASKGGYNTLENAQNTCRTCNRQKGNKTSGEYKEWKGSQ